MKRSFIFLLCLVLTDPVCGMHRSVAAVHVRTTTTRMRARSMPRLRTLEVRSQEDVDAITQVTDPYFMQVPGYPELRRKLAQSLDDSRLWIAKGYPYELETALYLLCKEHQTILAFEKKYIHPVSKKKREIDIVTNCCACECKNITWESVQQYPYIAAQLAMQFTEQNELVRSGVVGVQHFMVCSKNPIPFNWKLWFAQRNILYMEGPY